MSKGQVINVEYLHRIKARDAVRAFKQLACLPNGDTVAVYGPSFVAALQEQLGLKLVSSKGLVDILVIDHAEPPTPV